MCLISPEDLWMRHGAATVFYQCVQMYLLVLISSAVVILRTYGQLI